MYYANGDIYEGGWLDDFREGWGLFWGWDGTLYEGYWEVRFENSIHEKNVRSEYLVRWLDGIPCLLRGNCVCRSVFLIWLTEYRFCRTKYRVCWLVGWLVGWNTVYGGRNTVSCWRSRRYGIPSAR